MQNRVVRTILLAENLFDLRLQTLHFTLSLGHDELDGIELGWRRFFGQVENIGVIRNRDITGSQASQEGGFSTAVGSEQTVSTSEIEFDGGIGDEYASVEAGRKGKRNRKKYVCQLLFSSIACCLFENAKNSGFFLLHLQMRCAIASAVCFVKKKKVFFTILRGSRLGYRLPHPCSAQTL